METIDFVIHSYDERFELRLSHDEQGIYLTADDKVHGLLSKVTLTSDLSCALAYALLAAAGEPAERLDVDETSK